MGTARRFRRADEDRRLPPRPSLAVAYRRVRARLRAGPRAAMEAGLRAALLACLLAPAAVRGDTLPAYGRLDARTWTRRDGLPHDTVKAVAQTGEGFLWAATYAGVVRFDGVTFRSEARAAGMTRDTTVLHVDDHGVLWVGTITAGLFAIPPDGEVLHIVEGPGGLDSDHVWTLAGGGSEPLWIGTVNGPCRRSVDGMVTCHEHREGLPAGPVTGLLLDPTGGHWLAIEGGGVFRLDPDGGPARDLSAGLDNLLVQDLALADGLVYAATFGSGVQVFDGDRWRRVPGAGDAAAGLVRSLHGDPEGGLWIGTYGAGVERLEGGRLFGLPAAFGDATGHVHTMFTDREGSLWVGTNGGLTQLRRTPFGFLGVAAGLAGAYARTVAEAAGGDVLVGSDDGGLSVVRDDRVVARLTEDDGLLSRSVRSLLPLPDGSVLVASFGGGIQRYRDGRLGPWPLDRPQPTLVRALARTADGAVWIANHREGLIRVLAGATRRFDRSDGLPSLDVRSLAEGPEGRLWVGTQGGGAAVLGAEGFEPLFLGEPFEHAFDIQFDAAGNAWLGTDAGLRVRRVDGTVERFDGSPLLRDEAIFRVILAERAAWLCTSRGIVSAERDEATLLIAETARAFDRADGLTTSQCNGGSQPAGWLARSGRVWLPVSDGVAWVDSEADLTLPMPPPPVIERFVVDGEARPAGRIAPGARRFELHYSSPGLYAPEALHFRYRLTGLDDEWIDAARRRTAFYTNLAPGAYEFSVQAATATGRWNEPATFAFEILPGFFERTSVKLALIVLAMAAAVLVTRWRSRDLRRRSQRLAHIVAERTAALMRANDDLEAALRDLSQAQDQLVEQRKLSALGAMVAGIAHEINTPLGNSVMVTSHLLQEARRAAEGPDEAKAGYAARVVERLTFLTTCLARASELVRTFKLAGAGRRDFRRDEFDLASLLESIVHRWRGDVTEAGHVLHVDCPEGLILDSFAEPLREVVECLIRNSLAHAFDGPGGTLSIAVRHGPEGRITIDYRDDGRGIDEEIRERVFEPFFTQHRGRGYSGIGLHIAYNQVTNLLGGYLRCLGDRPGAHFQLEIPVRAR